MAFKETVVLKSFISRALESLHRLVLWLPAFQLFKAEEAHGGVGAVLCRRVDEACFGHLEKKT